MQPSHLKAGKQQSRGEGWGGHGEVVCPAAKSAKPEFGGFCLDNHETRVVFRVLVLVANLVTLILLVLEGENPKGEGFGISQSGSWRKSSFLVAGIHVLVPVGTLGRGYLLPLDQSWLRGLARTKTGCLLSAGSWADRSPLHEAASQGRLLALQTLLSQVRCPLCSKQPGPEQRP